ncbi:MAG: N-acetyl-gamma-glutamyl-phosphate reductase [Candidatus Azotimanducaceae bacterium]|jgi:N-acetyl-gamma-glutamyl-phosphate reductase
MFKIFIDGQAGTTGLQIHQRLKSRTDIELLSISDEDRKNPAAKQSLLEEADISILCLPDDAARASVKLAGSARILDASTAYRTNKDWVYGLPELETKQRERIRNAQLVSNPGCYPTGFLLAIRPLLSANLIQTDVQLSISAISGYSGGGRQLIEEYENPSTLRGKWSVRPYALNFGHKHLPEMKTYSGLSQTPLFLPSVGDYLQGMLVSIPLAQTFFKQKTTLSDLFKLLSEYYSNEDCVIVHEPNDVTNLDKGFLDPQQNNDTNRNDIYLFGHDEQILLVSQLDNLGKGASGAAVQNLNLMLDVEEMAGLSIERSI